MCLTKSKLSRFFIKLLGATVVFFSCFVLYNHLSYENFVPSRRLIHTAKIYVPPLSVEILEIHRRLNLTNPGYMGTGVILPKDLPEDILAKVKESQEKYKFNEFISQLIPLDRKLPDYRTEECKSAQYSQDLPKVSIIISFYNEPFSMVMRSIYSILNRTQLNSIEEILLVDDCSDSESLLNPLLEIIPKLPKVKIIRSPVRLGLMKARIIGADHAKGPILIIMDAHIEVAPGWLQPLIDPIAKNPRTITIPTLELLDPETLEYKNHVLGPYSYIGGFTWELMYTWFQIPMPNRSDIPLKSPTMMGAGFAIRKDFFESLGYYDTGFELWGGENLELSFKVWMCGGEMYQTFCSHVCHILRERPYWNKDADKTKMRNTDRLAEVWLDDYKHFYYDHRKYEHIDYGDITEQKRLREKLNCKSFQWYVDFICSLVRKNENTVYNILGLCKSLD